MPALDRKRFISKNANAAIHQRSGHDGRIVPMIMVAENRDHRNSFPTRQYIGTRLRMMGTRWAEGLTERGRNEVSGEREQVRAKRSRNSHGFLYPGFSQVRAKVNVRDMCNAKSMKRVGQAGEANLDMLRNRMMGFHQQSLSTGRAKQRGPSVGGETSSRNWWRHLTPV